MPSATMTTPSLPPTAASAATKTTTTTTSLSLLGRRAMLIIPLILSLWLLTDDAGTNDRTREENRDDDEREAQGRRHVHVHHLAVITALKYHPLDGYYDDDGEDVPALSKKQQSSSSSSSLSKPPRSIDVVSAALDMTIILLITLFLFTLSSAAGTNHPIHGLNHSGDTDGTKIMELIADVAAPIFPLTLFLIAVFTTVFPWNRRKYFWVVLFRTVGAPFHEVTFRDGFIGDILTSSVRPLQDVAFTIFYLFSGLQGWWTKSYNINDADIPVERSWLLHTVVLPACMISPLFCRFLQNLRQCYESKRRWPYLGNAAKYFVAAEVALFGLFDPSRKQTYTWLMCFFVATLYQVWWDVFMDWELFVWRKENNGRDCEIGGGSSMMHGRGIQRKRFLSWNLPFELRSERVYRFRATYWFIFVINFLLRFCWTLSFIPPRYLNRSGALLNTFSTDFETFVGPAIASAEIIRRTLWGLLRLELEAIKVYGDELGLARTSVLSSPFRQGWSDRTMLESSREYQPWELKPMSVEGISDGQSKFRTLGPMLRSYAVLIKSDMSESSDLQILAELCLWATAFTSLGIIAAAHREVM